MINSGSIICGCRGKPYICWQNDVLIFYKMEETSVQTTLNTYTLQIPKSDCSFFNSLVRKMGWTAKRTNTRTVIPVETLKALKEARSGKDAGVVDTSSVDAFIKSME